MAKLGNFAKVYIAPPLTLSITPCPFKMLPMRITPRLAHHARRSFHPALQTTPLLTRNFATEVQPEQTGLRSIADLPGITHDELLIRFQKDPMNFHLVLSGAWHDLGQPALFKMPVITSPNEWSLQTTDLEVCKHILTNNKYWYRPATLFLEYCYGRVTDGKGIHGIVNRNPPDWEKHRSIANKALLHPKANARFVVDMDDHARTLVSRLREQSSNQRSVDVAPALQNYTFSVIMKAAFGELVDFESGSNSEGVQVFEAVGSLLDAARNYAWMPPPYPDNEIIRTLNDELLKIRDFGIRLMDERRSRAARGEDIGHTDFASAVFMLRDENGQMLEASDVITDSLDLLVGGTDTTAAGLSFALHNLGRRPDILQKAYDEVAPLMRSKNDAAVTNEEINSLAYVNAILKETLRLTPPAALNGRVAGISDAINGIDIPAGTTVVISTMDIQHSDKYYDRPKEFVPERWLDKNVKINPYAWLPFGAGARGCLGQRLSVTEAKVALAHLIYNFDFKSEKQEELPTAMGVTMSPLGPVNISFKERN
ncbi:cytochrome P450 [Endogone sp. FLAS-F59071]|nr:cytochrome P450 [Endogone sp. FLAS-F59071]|eukprot:RUS22042.1 cytochrome P450 [Endogone sp. FLAS-F59071]